VKNYTRPESVVTTSDNMYVTFTAKRRVKTEIFLEITAGLAKSADLNLTESVVSDNNGRGVWVKRMRSNVHIHNSHIKRNNHIAGLHIDEGAGYVNVTHSRISENYVDGVNITYGGGCQNVSWSQVSDNIGAGISLWLNETTVNTPVRQEFVVAYSNTLLEPGVK